MEESASEKNAEAFYLGNLTALLIVFLVVLAVYLPEPWQIRNRSMLFLLLSVLVYLIFLYLPVHPVFAFATGITGRLLLLPAYAFSTDFKRYLSDGLNILAGGNPYATAPLSGIDNPHLTTMYGLVPEITFAGLSAILADERIFKLLSGGAELILLVWLYRRDKRLTSLLLIHPLLLHENWAEGHFDMAGITLLTIAVHPDVRSALIRYGSLAASIAVKWHGILLAPLWLWQHIRTGRWKHVIIVSTLLSLALLSQLPVFLRDPDGAAQITGMGEYLRYWEFASLPYDLLSVILDQKSALIVQYSMLSLTGFLIFFLFVVGRLTANETFARGSLVFLLLFPVNHPWYWLLLIPGIVASRATMLPGLAAMALTMTSYLHYIQIDLPVTLFCAAAYYGLPLLQPRTA